YFTGLSTQLETLKSNLTLLARNSQEILAAEQESLAQLIANTSELAKNLESLEKALAANRGSLGKFHRESKSLRDNIRLTAEYGRSFVRCIRERPWVIIYKESCRQR
ncbi:MAG: hypothetical protein N2Z22_08265, partial [Turneriella sp.]|nr:hypothetical protein [Turneriella sp.]